MTRYYSTLTCPQFESPLWAGRLPLRVGEPAGGSLTADEYKFAVTGPWAMIVCLSYSLHQVLSHLMLEIPVVWERFFNEANKEHKTAAQRYAVLLKEYERKKKAWEKSSRNATEPTPPIKPRPRLQKGEDENFLRFCAFLKIVVGNSIRTDTLPTVKNLLRDYLLNFSKVCPIDESVLYVNDV